MLRAYHGSRMVLRPPLSRATEHASFRRFSISTAMVTNSANVEVKLDKECGIDQRSRAIDLSYDSAIRCLRAYHALHGDLAIPRRYIVPTSDIVVTTNDKIDFPQEWHGRYLAETVYKMRWWQRHVRSQSQRVAELNELGFIWERLQSEWNLVVEALLTYKNVYGDLMVPLSFIVPHGDEYWPAATWGIGLGNIVYRIRSRQGFVAGNPERIDQLNGMDFVWDVSEYLFQKFVLALKIYRKDGRKSASPKNVRFNVLQVPSKFIIPPNEPWPEELHGYPLGDKCTAVRQKELYIKNSPERRKTLEELGFQFGGNTSVGWHTVMHAAAIYSQINGRILDVPQSFVVPSPPPPLGSTCSSSHDGADSDKWSLLHDDHWWPWSEYLWGFPLGQRLKDIRIKGMYLKGNNAKERIAQLDGLGFVWKPQMGRRTFQQPQPPRIQNSSDE